MDILHSIVLGIVEGITEFLPISSTGHLIWASKLLSIPQTDFVKSFEIILQSGAILAVISLYWKDILTKQDSLKKIAAAFIPTGIIGFILYKFIKHYLIGDATLVLWTSLLGGIAIIAIELYLKRRKITEKDITKITYKDAVIIGIIQSIAVVPGVSRSAATISAEWRWEWTEKPLLNFHFSLQFLL